MYFSWLLKKTPENWSTNVHEKIYLGRFRVLELFSTTLNDRIFLSSRALKKVLYQHELMYFSWLKKKTPENWSTNVLKKIYLGRLRVLKLFTTTLHDQIFLPSRALKKYYISLNFCMLVGYTGKHPKIEVPMSSKKFIWVGFGFSNFFRLL